MTEKIEQPDFSKYPELNKYFTKKDKFILDENNNAIPATLMEWGMFLENEHDRKIVKQEMVNGFRVSTVFLGLDHNWNIFNEENHKPHIFETMVFKGEGGTENYCDRYSTWEEAEEGHKVAVVWVKNGCKEEDEKQEE